MCAAFTRIDISQFHARLSIWRKVTIRETRQLLTGRPTDVIGTSPMAERLEEFEELDKREVA